MVLFVQNVIRHLLHGIKLTNGWFAHIVVIKHLLLQVQFLIEQDFNGIG